MIIDLLLIILALTVCNAVLRCSASKASWVTGVLALAASIWCYVLYPFAIEQSVPVLTKLPEDPVWLQRITVIILGELLLRWQINQAMFKEALGYPLKKWQRWLRFIPLPGLPAALFLFQVLIFYHVSGLGFQTLAFTYALVTALILLLLAVLFRWALPGREQRLELGQALLMLTAVSTCLLSVGAQFNQQGTTADKVADYRPFAVLLLLVLLVGGMGYLFSNIKTKKNGYTK